VSATSDWRTSLVRNATRKNVSGTVDRTPALPHNTEDKEVTEMSTMKATAGEVGKNFGLFADKALAEPVTITKYGREHLVLLSADEYARLKRRDRQVYRVSEVPDDLLAAIEATEPSPESEAVERELAGKYR
jgi:prevent-host-death family protein